MTRSQQAQNAKIKIDNVAMEFDKNDITTAIPNLRIDLNKAAPGTTVTVATDQPTSTMGDLVQQIVDAYNTLKGGAQHRHAHRPTARARPRACWRAMRASATCPIASPS